MTENIGSVVTEVFLNSFTSVLAGFPTFLGGLLILFVGLLSASVLEHALLGVLRVLRLERWIEKTKLARGHDIKLWQDLLVQIVRWTVVILFLVPALETWGIPGVNDVLAQILLYLPSVFVAAVVGFLGIIIANLTYGVVKHGAKSLGGHSASTVAGISRYSLLFFTGLVVLHQLGVATELIRILFTGIVAMLAIAGGLAFGLGGQDTARDVLKEIREKLEK